MSNRDETRKTDVLRPAEAMRGATRAPTRARRRASPRRMLRGERVKGALDRTRPVCEESVTACIGSVQTLQRRRARSGRSARIGCEREYVVAMDSRESPPTLPCRRPWESPHWRSSKVPTDGHQISPWAAIFSPHVFVLICRLSIRVLLFETRVGGRSVKKAEEVMEILEAYDMAGTLRGAAALAGCDHKTVAHWAAVREQAGGMPPAPRRRPAVGDFAGKIDELVERSHGKIRADAAHGKLVALGYQGSSRTTRRWVAESKRRWRREH